MVMHGCRAYGDDYGHRSEGHSDDDGYHMVLGTVVTMGTIW